MQKHQLTELAIGMLCWDESGTVAFPANCQEVFSRALDAMFESKVAAKEELHALLRIAFALETTKRSPRAARELIRAIARHERSISALGLGAGNKTRALRTRFAKLAGAEAPMSAPVYGKEAPNGTLKLRSFLDPGAEPKRGRPRPGQTPASRR